MTSASASLSATANVAVGSDSGFGEKNRFVGRLGYSADGLRQNGSGGALQAEVPEGAKVQLAYLYGSYHVADPSLDLRTIRFAGEDVTLTQIPSNAGGYLSAARADVTDEVAAALAGGSRSFTIANDPVYLDGLALLVVYEHPDLPVSTIAVIDGGASQSGQRTTLQFAAPLDPGAPGFAAMMSLGIGYGYQGGSHAGTHTCGTDSAQSSIIDVNDRGLTSCAGNYDDGVGNNGGLITVGGVGDSLANPSDPFQSPGDRANPRIEDDELYDLVPFIGAGERTLEIETVNPSHDDIIFLTVIAISARIESVSSVPIGQTFGTGASGHGGNPTGFQADPVNSWSGYFVTTTTDAVLPTAGPTLRLDRTYTSGDDARSLLGRGWSSSWDVRLEPGPDAIVFVAEDGQRLVYERSFGRALVPPVGAWSELTENGDGFELVRRDGLRYQFDSEGRLQDVRDARGLGFAVERALHGAITAVVDDAGRRTRFTTDDAGLLTAVELADGRTVRYAYSDGLLARMTDVRGGTVAYSYDASERLVSIVDQAGTTLVTNSYDLSGRVTEQVDALGAVTTFTWDADALTSTMTDAEGGQWRDHYDQEGRLVRRVDPVGGVVSYEWNDSLDVIGVVDAGGDRTSYEYDDRGNVVEVIGPDRSRVSFAYDEQGDLSSVTNGNGGTTSFAHDPARNLVAVTGPLQHATRVEYERGLPVSVVDRRGGTTSLSYDERGNLVASAAPGGGTTRYVHDPAGRVTEIVDATGRSARYRYDAAGNVVEAQDQAGTTTFAYDATGRRISATDANGGTRRFSYDVMGRLVTTTAADGGTTRYTYDRAGRVTSRTDGNGHRTRYSWDAAGRVVAVTLPTREVWQLGYDADGNAVEVTTPRGPVFLGYDALDRLVRIDYSDDTPDVTMTYDANGNRLTQTDGAGTRTFTYDAEDRLIGAARGSDAFAYAYDFDGNVVRRSYPDGREVGYDYSVDGLLTAVTEGGARTTYSYDDAGRLVRATHPNGTVERRTYDEAGRLTGVVHATAKGRYFDGSTAELDNVGNPVVVRSAADGRETTFRYDAENRLVEECAAAACPVAGKGAARVTYTYDAAGNRRTMTRPGGTTTYTYDASDRLLRTEAPTGTTEFEYDAAGNRTRAGASHYTYDLANRLVGASTPDGSADYTYDGDGVLRTAGSTEYLWDIAAPSPLLAGIRSDGTITPLTHGHDLLRVGSSYAHQNAVGTVTSLTDGAGIVRAKFDYDAFGAVTRASGRDAGDGPVMGFAGMPLDTVTGLTHLLARAYDPVTGTFLQRDPLATAITSPAQSSYGWVGNRPTVLTDPTGQCPFCVLAGVGAVVGAVIGGAAYAVTTDDFQWDEFGGSVAGGAIAGAVAGVAGPLGGSAAMYFGAGASGLAAGAATVGITALGGAAGTTASSLIGQQRWPTGQELAVGAAVAAGTGVAGGWVSGLMGASTRGMTTVAQARHFAPRTWASLVSGKPNISAIYRGAAVGGAFELGTAWALDWLAPTPISGK